MQQCDIKTYKGCCLAPQCPGTVGGKKQFMLPVWPEWPSRLNTFLVEQLCERSFNSISLLVSWTGGCVPHSPVQLTTREPVSIVVSHICPDGFVLVLSEVIGFARWTRDPNWSQIAEPRRGGC